MLHFVFHPMFLIFAMLIHLLSNSLINSLWTSHNPYSPAFCCSGHRWSQAQIVRLDLFALTCLVLAFNHILILCIVLLHQNLVCLQSLFCIMLCFNTCQNLGVSRSKATKDIHASLSIRIAFLVWERIFLKCITFAHPSCLKQLITFSVSMETRSSTFSLLLFFAFIFLCAFYPNLHLA